MATRSVRRGVKVAMLAESCLTLHLPLLELPPPLGTAELRGAAGVHTDLSVLLCMLPPLFPECLLLLLARRNGADMCRHIFANLVLFCPEATRCHDLVLVGTELVESHAVPKPPAFTFHLMSLT